MRGNRLPSMNQPPATAPTYSYLRDGRSYTTNRYGADMLRQAERRVELLAPIHGDKLRTPLPEIGKAWAGVEVQPVTATLARVRAATSTTATMNTIDRSAMPTQRSASHATAQASAVAISACTGS